MIPKLLHTISSFHNARSLDLLKFGFIPNYSKADFRNNDWTLVWSNYKNLSSVLVVAMIFCSIPSFNIHVIISFSVDHLVFEIHSNKFIPISADSRQVSKMRQVNTGPRAHYCMLSK